MDSRRVPIRGDPGVLITCDPPMKQFILYINETEAPPFVIANLDATHLVIHQDYVEKVQTKIAQYVEEQNVDPEKYRHNKPKKS
jgi:TFIIH basal transcription factor complex TTD-A subunit